MSNAYRRFRNQTVEWITWIVRRVTGNPTQRNLQGSSPHGQDRGDNHQESNIATTATPAQPRQEIAPVESQAVAEEQHRRVSDDMSNNYESPETTQSAPENDEVIHIAFQKQAIWKHTLCSNIPRFHIIVTGLTQSGKSSLINTWATGMCDDKQIHWVATVGAAFSGADNLKPNDCIHHELARYVLRNCRVTCWEAPGFDLCDAASTPNQGAEATPQQGPTEATPEQGPTEAAVTEATATDYIRKQWKAMMPQSTLDELNDLPGSQLSRPMHMAVITVHSKDAYATIDSPVIIKLRKLHDALRSLGYQPVLVMTAAELLFEDDSTEQISVLSRAQAVLSNNNATRALRNLANNLGFSLQNAFVAINYTRVPTRDVAIDNLALMSLNKTLDIARDRICYLNTAVGLMGQLCFKDTEQTEDETWFM